MLIDGCKTGLKLGHFPKIENLFNQKWAWPGRGQNPRLKISYLA